MPDEVTVSLTELVSVLFALERVLRTLVDSRRPTSPTWSTV
jgi:hypothetical protein